MNTYCELNISACEFIDDQSSGNLQAGKKRSNEFQMLSDE